MSGGTLRSEKEKLQSCYNKRKREKTNSTLRSENEKLQSCYNKRKREKTNSNLRSENEKLQSCTDPLWLNKILTHYSAIWSNQIDSVSVTFWKFMDLIQSNQITVFGYSKESSMVLKCTWTRTWHIFYHFPIMFCNGPLFLQRRV